MFAEEPVDPANPLLALSNVVVTPHVTWYTVDTMRRYLTAAIDNCRRPADGQPLMNVVGSGQEGLMREAQALEARTVGKVMVRLVLFPDDAVLRQFPRPHQSHRKDRYQQASGTFRDDVRPRVGIFFIGYVLVEVPSNLALEKFGARRWLARIAVSWGIVVVAIGFAPNAATLLTLIPSRRRRSRAIPRRHLPRP